MGSECCLKDLHTEDQIKLIYCRVYGVLIPSLITQFYSLLVNDVPILVSFLCILLASSMQQFILSLSNELKSSASTLLIMYPCLLILCNLSLGRRDVSQCSVFLLYFFSHSCLHIQMFSCTAVYLDPRYTVYIRYAVYPFIQVLMWAKRKCSLARNFFHLLPFSTNPFIDFN